MSGPVFYNLATLASIFLFFVFFACFGGFARFGRLILVVSLELVIWLGRFSGFPRSVVAFCYFGHAETCHLMIFDVICPCLKLLPLSNFGLHLRDTQ